jgi:hypothetical protein
MNMWVSLVVLVLQGMLWTRRGWNNHSIGMIGTTSCTSSDRIRKVSDMHCLMSLANAQPYACC